LFPSAELFNRYSFQSVTSQLFFWYLLRDSG